MDRQRLCGAQGPGCNGEGKKFCLCGTGRAGTAAIHISWMNGRGGGYNGLPLRQVKVKEGESQESVTPLRVEDLISGKKKKGDVKTFFWSIASLQRKANETKRKGTIASHDRALCVLGRRWEKNNKTRLSSPTATDVQPGNRIHTRGRKENLAAERFSEHC